MDAFSNVFSRRNMQWNMGFLYPGLCMRLSPSATPGSQLEFILDPHREAANVHSLKEASTGISMDLDTLKQKNYKIRNFLKKERINFQHNNIYFNYKILLSCRIMLSKTLHCPKF